LTLTEYWLITPYELELRLKVYQDKSEARVMEQDTLNHLLGRYIAYAVNDPKKYPKYPFLKKEKNDTIELMIENGTNGEELAEKLRAMKNKIDNIRKNTNG
jgi:predicted ribosome quality control (RQC) complex YloA/Tae2 family protein